MKHLIRLLIAFCLFGYGTLIQAQSTFPATGGNATGAGGTTSYTVGQVIYITTAGINGTLTHGVQQPYEISVPTEINEAKNINLLLTAYPNPTTDYLTLKVEEYDKINLFYCLYGSGSNLIESNKILTNEIQIFMKNLPPGIYFLEVKSGNKDLKTFKIVKN